MHHYGSPLRLGRLPEIVMPHGPPPKRLSPRECRVDTRRRTLPAVADAAAWHDFYVMAGGAAAALTGLVVVALSLHAKAIMAHPLYRDRAFAAILALMTQVFLSAAVLVPGQPPAALGVEIGIAALFWLGRSLWAIPYIRNNTRRLRGRAYEYRRSTAHWVAEWSVWIAWVIALMASSTALIAGSADGFYWLAAAMVLMFGSQVWSAWVLISEVTE